MNDAGLTDLARWKAALEKWGIESRQLGGDVPGIGCPYVSAEGVHGSRGIYLTTYDHDSSAVEFIGCILLKCFGPWAWIEPTYDAFGNPAGWAVCSPRVPIEMCDEVRIHNHHGFGPTKRAALLDAMEKNEPK